jgi:hypothetical protein
MTDKVPKTASKRPQPKGGSRKGKPNKTTAAIKEMIEGALQDVGGQAYLAKQAEENPSAFMGLVGKILPKDITLGGPGGGPVIVEMVKRIVDPKRDT